MRRVPFAMLCVTLTSGVVLLPARYAAAVVPGPNGLIAFQSDRDGDPDIFSVAPDGTGLAQLTYDTIYEADPTWSPDGTRIAFVKESDASSCSFTPCRNVWVMNADGSNSRQVTNEAAAVNDSGPAWSPDGLTIAYASTVGGGPKEILTIQAAGGAPIQLTNGSGQNGANWFPDWAPDGSKILFVSLRTGASQLFTMDPDGSHQAQVSLSGAPPGANVGEPAWAPDGARVAFRGSATLFATPTQVFVANVDGSNAHSVYDPGWNVYTPAWSPDGARIVATVDTGGPAGLELEVIDPVVGIASPLASSSADELNPGWGSAQPGPVPTPPPAPPPGHVSAGDNAYSPAALTVAAGTLVVFDFAGPSSHSVTDATGMRLYDSGARGGGGPSLTYAFYASGGYAFRCTLHRKMTGAVQVPMSVLPASGSSGTTFALTWATRAAPSGFAYDVEFLRPHSKKWTVWKTGSIVGEGSFNPSAGPGVYAFRARLREVSSGAAAAYSPAASVSVT